MKKLHLLLLTLFIGLGIYAQDAKVNIPDTNFKDELLSKHSIDTNGDGEIQESEAAAFTGEIVVGPREITSLQGIEKFPNIIKLVCDSKNTLKGYLDFSANTQLENINLYGCRLDSINISQCVELKELNCRGNFLTKLDVANNTKLIKLNASQTRIKSIELNRLTELKSLLLHYCALRGTLDLSANTALIDVFVAGNSLYGLKLPSGPNLKRLGCENNFSLYSLNLSACDSISELYCSRNNMSNLIISTNKTIKN